MRVVLQLGALLRAGWRLILTTTILLSFAKPGASEGPGESTPQFGGNVRFEIQFDDVEGRDQGRPKWIQTLSLNPSLTIHGFTIDLP